VLASESPRKSFDLRHIKDFGGAKLNETTLEVEVIAYDNHDCKFIEALLTSHRALKRLRLFMRGECADYVMLDRTPLAIEELEFAPDDWEHT